jgi:hypothetical protein
MMGRSGGGGRGGGGGLPSVADAKKAFMPTFAVQKSPFSGAAPDEYRVNYGTTKVGVVAMTEGKGKLYEITASRTVYSYWGAEHVVSLRPATEMQIRAYIRTYKQQKKEGAVARLARLTPMDGE